MKKAIIENGKVINIIECSDEGLKGLRFPLGQLVWDCNNYPVAIGDDFNDGVFTRSGEGLEAAITETQMIGQLNEKVRELEEVIDVMLEGII